MTYFKGFSPTFERPRQYAADYAAAANQLETDEDAELKAKLRAAGIITQ